MRLDSCPDRPSVEEVDPILLPKVLLLGEVVGSRTCSEEEVRTSCVIEVAWEPLRLRSGRGRRCDGSSDRGRGQEGVVQPGDEGVQVSDRPAADSAPRE